MNDEPKPKTGWTWLQIGVVAVVVFWLVAAAIPTINLYAPRRNLAVSMANCRQIVTALKQYASDHGGQYPDSDSSHPATANQAFRLLIKEGYVDDESVFGARLSPFRPDGRIGSPPDYLGALLAGENHWAMTKGLKNVDDGTIPLLFENPSAIGWPPMWNVDAAGRAVRGRVWRNGVVVCGFNERSVGVLKMSESSGTKVLPSKEGAPDSVFTYVADHMEILDIEP